ncbi:Phospholipase A1 [Flavobacterium urumqiense]|uniref:Phosphatidylcholine 1-acylhydrolase n=1 Tax=Flavobacterium urumqiense TaxID=935224 RepID=A0A1H5ZIH8_9FLAO|nr:Phospholipase A1 [Flavobacterium urumqiense]
MSFKTKVLQKFFRGHIDFWVAYTEISYWQIYNTNLLRPFREVNYEPELILNFPVKFKLFGLNIRMIGMAINHESNWNSDPYSLSWNRIIFHAGFLNNHLSIYSRPWLILSAAKNDNPDIA